VVVEKIDLFKQLKADYKLAEKPVLFETMPGQYLTITGEGKPGGEGFQRAVAAMYSMAFTVKMTRKAHGQGDYVVCKLEALWWAGKDADFARVDQGDWQWKLLIRTPDYVEGGDVQQAAQALLRKGKALGVNDVALEKIDEGLCVQMLHLGPYEKEYETIALMEAFMAEEKVMASGPHHEIYISDPRRIEPERLKTILRQPVVNKELQKLTK